MEFYLPRRDSFQSSKRIFAFCNSFLVCFQNKTKNPKMLMLNNGYLFADLFVQNHKDINNIVKYLLLSIYRRHLYVHGQKVRYHARNRRNITFWTRRLARKWKRKRRQIKNEERKTPRRLLNWKRCQKNHFRKILDC